jgi:outer membrane protein OmpA-like peptidoglycan-associated protein
MTLPPPMTMPTQQMAALTPPPGMPANAVMNMSDDPFATVVVSSSGVEMIGSAKTAAQMPRLSTATALKTALRLPSGPPPGGQRVATILFSNGSYSLTGRDRQILGEIVRLQRERGGKVRIVGHASSRTRNMDPVRHKMVNYKVSVDRAEIIGKQLMRLGLASADVYVDALSDTAPLYYESMPSGEAGNRRAEIYLEN